MIGRVRSRKATAHALSVVRSARRPVSTLSKVRARGISAAVTHDPTLSGAICWLPLVALVIT